MGQRIDLHRLICDAIRDLVGNAEKHVFFQPPASVKLVYPCIVYKLDDIPVTHADNDPYLTNHTYQMTVIDRDPESPIRERIAQLPKCRMQRAFVADNLNHYVFRIYN